MARPTTCPSCSCSSSWCSSPRLGARSRSVNRPCLSGSDPGLALRPGLGPPSAAVWFPGSFRFKCMRALDLRRSIPRAPALKAAVAASECGEYDEGDGGETDVPLFAGGIMREEDGEREGGRELRSGISLMPSTRKKAACTVVGVAVTKRSQVWSSCSCLRDKRHRCGSFVACCVP